ncbi:hypothetical protein G7046_g4285 [Stylonectria norvegica]|nr:hypothetical protein G7046_g4285 [Stylonectria norvegica]
MARAECRWDKAKSDLRVSKRKRDLGKLIDARSRSPGRHTLQVAGPQQVGGGFVEKGMRPLLKISICYDQVSSKALETETLERFSLVGVYTNDVRIAMCGLLGLARRLVVWPSRTSALVRISLCTLYSIDNDRLGLCQQREEASQPLDVEIGPFFFRRGGPLFVTVLDHDTTELPIHDISSADGILGLGLVRFSQMAGGEESFRYSSLSLLSRYRFGVYLEAKNYRSGVVLVKADETLDGGLATWVQTIWPCCVCKTEESAGFREHATPCEIDENPHHGFRRKCSVPEGVTCAQCLRAQVVATTSFDDVRLATARPGLRASHRFDAYYYAIPVPTYDLSSATPAVYITVDTLTTPTMADIVTQSIVPSEEPHPVARSNSSSSTSPSDHSESIVHQPIPTRPRLPSRKSSGPMVVPRDSLAVGPVEPDFGPDDVRAMSPRRTTEDIDKLGKQAREEMRRHAQALQDSLLTIFNRIEAVREEHDKLNNNNKFLQKYIGDLMSTSKITASGSRGKK